MKKNKTIVVLMLIAGLSKLVGFSREIILSYFWGATNISDAYLISTTIPTTIFTFVGVGITTGFIPIYTEIKQKEGRLQSNAFVNKLLVSTLLICCGLIAVGELFCGPLVRIFASGFDQETYRIAVTFTRVSLFEIGFTTIMYIMTAYLQSEDSFIAPALASFPMNLMTIGAIWLSSNGNYYFLCIGCLAASFAQAAFLVPFAFRKGFRITRIANPRGDSKIKELFALALPTIIGTSVNDINVLVDRTLASNLSVGGISALNYASKINAFLQGIIVLSIVSYIYPKIAKFAVNQDSGKLKNVIDSALVSIVFILLPASCVLIIFAEKIVSLIFGHGAFDRDAVLMTSSVLAFYSIGMIANGLREVFSRVLFAHKDSKTPMINGAIGMVINIVLNLVLSSFMGIDGLALSTSVSSFCILVMLMYGIARKKIWKPGRTLYVSLAKIAALSAVMCCCVLLGKRAASMLIGNEYVSIALSVLLGGIVYLLGAFLLDIREITSMLRFTKKDREEEEAPHE